MERLLTALSIILVFFSCQESEQSSSTKSRFQLLSPSKTGIDFSNDLIETSALNIYTWRYIYNGAGVAVGDINNDGLPDLYFCSNTGKNKLYLNKGELQFEDISEKSHVGAKQGFKTGVTMVDINADGYLDIYVCRDALPNHKLRENLLYINNGDLTFSEQARQYGLNDNSYSNQAIFFDYDSDDDLDMYLVNHPNDFSKATTTRMKKDPDGKIVRFSKSENNTMRDKLYRNNGDNTFSDVSLQAGIDNHAFGLSASITDINQDGHPDIFVGNDFIEPDFLYVNNGDGTFSESINQYFKHMSQNTMGNDFADINNDGLEDMIALDMMPEDNYRQKLLASSMMKERYNALLERGYGHQLMRNTLQLNNGNGSFSEIGELAGVAKTDWSWSSIFADLNNDGAKDLIITNGIRRDMSNMDYVQYKTDSVNKLYRKTGVYPIDGNNFRSWMELMPSNKLQNYVYKNSEDLTFEDVSDHWGFSQKSFSTGAVVSDLDKDGDLEVIMSNLDEPAFIYKNLSIENDSTQWIQVSLKYKGQNLNGIGSTIIIHSTSGTQTYSVKNSRGFISSSDHTIHAGLNKQDKIDQIVVTWPDSKTSVRQNVNANQSISMAYESSADKSVVPNQNSYLVEEVDLFIYKHEENTFNDFNRDPLIPHSFSRSGPFLSVGDINGDDLEDLFVGGAVGFPAKTFIQLGNGSFAFIKQPAFEVDNAFEDMQSVFFDIDNDGDQDLYVVSGGSEFLEPNKYLDRLYLNKGNGIFRASTKPESSNFSGSAVTKGDIDNDGDIDLFVGGKLVPGEYPKSPESVIFINEEGQLADQTSSYLEDPNLGMVNSAVFQDVNNDNYLDLVVAGEWTPIRIYENEVGSSFNEITPKAGLSNSTGWWNMIHPIDLENDGDIDFIAGNLGANSTYKASLEKPVEVFLNDFDQNGKMEPILTQYVGEERWPVARKELLSTVVPAIKKKFNSFEKYATASIEDLFGQENVDKAYTLDASELRSCLVINNGGTYQLNPLPNPVQIAPIMSVISTDLNQDGMIDHALAGNFLHSEVEQGPYDAGTGIILQSTVDGKAFSCLSSRESGFFVDGDSRDMVSITTKNGSFIIVSNNSGKLQAFKVLQNVSKM